jgi:competence protein ComEA
MFKKILAIVAMLFYTALALAAVDVNKATEAELDSVKGIGPGTSRLILAERKKGEFKSWEDFISRVKGVGETRAANLSEAGLTVGGKSYKPTATTGARKDDKATSAKSEARAEKKEAKTEAKAEKKEAKADAKAKEARAEAKAERKEAAAEKKEDRAAAASRPAASAARK